MQDKHSALEAWGVLELSAGKARCKPGSIMLNLWTQTDNSQILQSLDSERALTTEFTLKTLHGHHVTQGTQ